MFEPLNHYKDNTSLLKQLYEIVINMFFLEENYNYK